MKSMTRFLTAIVFAFISFSAFGQTPFYASYNWQRGQTFSDTVRFNDTLKTEGVQYLGGAGTQGLVTWNSDEETLDLITNGSTLQMGQEMVVHVRNNTGVDIPDGTAVMATGTLGASGRITVAPMVADGSVPARFYLGIATETIENGGDGKVATFGKIRDINTTAYAEGSVLWLDPSTPGGLTTIQPNSANLKIATALVISSKVNGTIFVRATTGTDLTTANDADLDSALDNSVIVRDSVSGLWVHAGDYTQWDSAYAHKVNSIAFNTGDGVLSLSRQGGGVISTDLDGRYLTSYTETDPIFTASPAFGIDGGDITNWDSVYSQVQNNYVNWDSAYVAANQAINQLSDINPNSQPIASQFFARARDSIAVGRNGSYIEYVNQVNSDLGRLLNQELTSGRTAYQDASIIYSPAFADSTSTASVKPLSGAGDLAFSRSSTATRVNSEGVIESVGTNVARFDFTQDATEPSLLLEPSRTNLLTYSEQFDNGVWQKSGTGSRVDPIVTANAGTAPDGAATADRVQFELTGNTTSDRCFLRQQETTTGGDHTVTFYVKSFTGDEYDMSLTFNGAPQTTITVNDEWQRFTYTAESNLAGFFGLEIRGGGTNSLTADVLVWGAQLEAGAYPTSYIKTEASTVTRAAESSSTTGIADLLGDSEGTILFEASTFLRDDSNVAIGVSDGTPTNRIQILFNNSSESVTATVVVGGVVQASISGNYTKGEVFNLAIGYQENDFRLFINGVKTDSDLSGSVFPDGTLTNFRLDRGYNSIFFYGNVYNIQVFDKALTDAELQLLTTPISLN